MTDHHTVSMFPALSRMETRFIPAKHGREPYWRAPVTPASAEVYTPSWSWASPIHELPEGAQSLSLDTNGSYLSALSMTVVAHAQLERAITTSWVETPRDVLPGYYKIKVPYWAFDATCVSPLGNSPRLQGEDTVWVTHPVIVLLMELLDEGTIAELVILDAYVSTRQTDFRAWAGHLKEVRNEVMDQVDAMHPDGRPSKCPCLACARYDAFKEGYSSALSMMLTGGKCKTHRPDWAHAVYGQFAAAQWRKAWRYTGTGHPLLSMGATDEITILARDLHEVLARTKPPFRYDESGRTLGAFKTKENPTPIVQQAEAVPVVTEGEDIL